MNCTDRQTERWMDRETDRQIDRQRQKETDRERDLIKKINISLSWLHPSLVKLVTHWILDINVLESSPLIQQTKMLPGERKPCMDYMQFEPCEEGLCSTVLLNFTPKTYTVKVADIHSIIYHCILGSVICLGIARVCRYFPSWRQGKSTTQECNV